MRGVLIVAATFAASFAWAQTSSTSSTDCRSYDGQTVHCDTQTTSQRSGFNIDWSILKPVDTVGAYQQGLEAGRQKREQQRLEEEEAALAVQAEQLRLERQRIADQERARASVPPAPPPPSPQPTPQVDTSSHEFAVTFALTFAKTCEEKWRAALSDLWDKQLRLYIMVVQRDCPLPYATTPVATPAAKDAPRRHTRRRPPAHN
jgi:hypothetical protein